MRPSHAASLSVHGSAHEGEAVVRARRRALVLMNDALVGVLGSLRRAGLTMTSPP